MPIFVTKVTRDTTAVIPKHGSIFFPEHQMVFDQGPLIAGIFYMPVSALADKPNLTPQLYYAPLLFPTMDTDHMQRKVEGYLVNLPLQTHERNPFLWPPICPWPVNGTLMTFEPELEISVLPFKREALSSPPKEALKALNSAAGRTHCAACKEPLREWNSGWSIGKYCPVCEK